MSPAHPASRRGLRLGPMGVVVRPRGLGTGVAMLVLLLALGAYALATGTLDYPLDRVLATLAGDGSSVEELVIIDNRLARASVAALVGFALGAAGGLTQSITRNPIASPDILGVTAGAGFFAVLLLTRPGLAEATTGERASTVLAPAAMVGGLATTALVLALAWRGGFDGFRLVLVGIGVNAVLTGGTAFLLSRAALDDAAVASRWLSGSTASATLADLPVLAAAVAVGTLCCLALHRDVCALRLGPDVARGLGVAVSWTTVLALVVAVVLVGCGVAVAGPVPFVAFAAPQVALRLFGTAGPPPLAAGLVGAVLLLGCDLVAQRLPVELPVGVVTAVAGAPLLLVLVVRHARRSGA